MRIAVAQTAGSPGDTAANLATVRRLAGEAAGGGARLVVFPEAFVTGYNIGRLAAELAEPVDGPGVAALADATAGAGIAILCGYCERAGDVVHNSAVLVGADGETVANARKTHLFGDVDRAVFTPGDAFTVATLEGLRVGIAICFDIEFPECARSLALAGAQLIAVPTSLMAPEEHVAETLVPARAAENQVFVAYANRVGTEGDLDYVGRSCVAGPDGSVLARAGATGEVLLYSDVDATAIERARRPYSYLDERRPALYAD